MFFCNVDIFVMGSPFVTAKISCLCKINVNVAVLISETASDNRNFLLLYKQPILGQKISVMSNEVNEK